MNIIGLVLLAVVANASPLTSGTIAVSGNGCYGDQKMVPAIGEKNRFELPVKVILDKKSKMPFERKTCNMRLPIKLRKNQKLQISDISQIVHMDGKGTKSTLTVAVVGKKAQPLIATTSKTVTGAGVLLESDCERDVILTGDLNVVANGSEIVSVKTESVFVTLKIVKCN